MKAAINESIIVPKDPVGDLSDYTFEGEGDGEGEIAELVKRSNTSNNSVEKNITFNKQGIIQFIDSKLRENTDDDSWRLRLQRDYIKMWTKDSDIGPMSKGVVFSKLELELDASYTLEQVIKAYNEPSNRLQWDNTHLQQLEVQRTPHKNVVLQYSQVRSKLQFKARDFFEKKVIFVDNDKLYCYLSTATSQEMPNKEGLERAETIFGIQKIERRPEDDKIILRLLMLADYKLPLSNSILKTFVPAGVKDWAQKFMNHLKFT